MKKVAIFTNNLEMGGVEKSLLDFIIKIKSEKNYNIKLYVLEKRGVLLEEFNKYVEIESLDNLYNNLCMNAKKEINENLKQLNIINIIKIIHKKISNVLYKKDTFYIVQEENFLKENYDVAICYQVPIHPLTIFVAERVNSKLKLLWNHAELASVEISLINKYKNILEKYDKIFSVSDDSNNNCKYILPDLKNKFDVFHNYVNIEMIKSMSKENLNTIFNKKYINILTVGRLSEDKGYDLLLEAASLLKDDNIIFKWFIIGDGELKVYIEKEIIRRNLEKNIVLLGKKKNPYKYMKQCDLYVQTSKFEGYGLTTLEAKILNKLIVTTRTSGISEKFKNEENAIICDINSIDIYNGIKRIIEDKNLSQLIYKNIETENYDIPDDFNKIYEMIDNI